MLDFRVTYRFNGAPIVALRMGTEAMARHVATVFRAYARREPGQRITDVQITRVSTGAIVKGED
jgi:hypothetical protein